MKATLLTTLMALFAIFSLSAQHKAYVQLDLHQTEFGSMHLEQMLSKTNAETRSHWDEIALSLRNAITDELNDNKKDWDFGYERDASYVITFVLQEYLENGYICGHVVAEYYRPGYHKLFYDTEFHAIGKDTHHYTRFSPKTFSKAAAQVKKSLLARLNKDVKERSKKKK